MAFRRVQNDAVWGCRQFRARPICLIVPPYLEPPVNFPALSVTTVTDGVMGRRQYGSRTCFALINARYDGGQDLQGFPRVR